MLPSVEVDATDSDLELDQPARDCTLYEHFRPFAQAKVSDETLGSRAEAISGLVGDIDKIVFSTSRRLQKKYDRLHKLTLGFVTQTLSQDDFYEGGDLLGRFYYELCCTQPEEGWC